MTTQLVTYHPNSKDYAVLLDEQGYWIGEWFPATHCSAEPPYAWIDGNFVNFCIAYNKLLEIVV